MVELLERMTGDLQLRGMSERTQEMYVRAVRQLSEHYHRSPDELSEPVGSGQEAFQYLAPYIFRVALCNNHILKLEHGKVTFQYKESHTGKRNTQTIPAEEFIRRFLQHILPHRFVKVRYYGLFASRNRPRLTTVRLLLAPQNVPTDQKTTPKEKTAARCCPNCGTMMTLVEEIPRKRKKPP